MKIYLAIFFTIFAWIANAQSIVPQTVGTLPTAVSESSGLIYIDNLLFTHNDGGNSNYIYQLDTTDASIVRSILVANAPNTDWEDLAQDANFLYVADIGNNQGNRTNLRIFRIAKSNLISSDTVFADTINISYANQTNFATSTFTTNFDAEALVATSDFLYVFSKQWGKAMTRIYKFPKTPGTYSAQPLDSLAIQGFITGADFNVATGTLCLLGNTSTNPYLIKITNFTWPNFSGGTKSTHPIFQAGSPQVEGICFGKNDLIYLSSEQFSNTSATLMKAAIGPDLAIVNHDFGNHISIFPNPTTSGVTVKLAPQYYGTSVHLVDMYGRLVSQLDHAQSEIILVSLPDASGIYFIQFYFGGALQHQQRIEKK